MHRPLAVRGALYLLPGVPLPHRIADFSRCLFGLSTSLCCRVVLVVFCPVPRPISFHYRCLWLRNTPTTLVLSTALVQSCLFYAFVVLCPRSHCCGLLSHSAPQVGPLHSSCLCGQYRSPCGLLGPVYSLVMFVIHSLVMLLSFLSRRVYYSSLTLPVHVTESRSVAVPLAGRSISLRRVGFPLTCEFSCAVGVA